MLQCVEQCRLQLLPPTTDCRTMVTISLKFQHYVIPIQPAPTTAPNRSSLQHFRSIASIHAIRPYYTRSGALNSHSKTRTHTHTHSHTSVTFHFVLMKSLMVENHVNQLFLLMFGGESIAKSIPLRARGYHGILGSVYGCVCLLLVSA